MASQKLLPTLLETRKVYSPLSLFSVLKIVSAELEPVLWTLYLWPEISSFPAFIHLDFIGLVPENLHSSLAGSPCVTLMDFACSEILAGSGTAKYSKTESAAAFIVNATGEASRQRTKINQTGVNTIEKHRFPTYKPVTTSTAAHL